MDTEELLQARSPGMVFALQDGDRSRQTGNLWDEGECCLAAKAQHRKTTRSCHAQAQQEISEETKDGREKNNNNKQPTTNISSRFKKPTQPEISNMEMFPNQTVPCTGSSMKKKDNIKNQQTNKNTRMWHTLYIIRREGRLSGTQHTDLAQEATWQHKALGIQHTSSDFVETQGCASGKAA